MMAILMRVPGAVLVVVMLLTGVGLAHTQNDGPGTPCPVPAGFNPYVDPFPAECRNQGFVPYQVAAGEFRPAVFLFAGGVLNAETLAYLDLTNSSSYAQRVDVEYQPGSGRAIVRQVVLAPKESKSIDLGADPELRADLSSFAVQVTFERLGNAALTMRTARDPFGPGALMPVPRIIELSATH